MKRLFFLLLSCYICVQMYGQLNLEQCRDLARANYPAIRRYGVIEKTREYTRSVASTGYMPRLSLSGKVSYQSDVTAIPIELPGIDIPTLSKDQYQAVLELNQTIWDGGTIRAQRSQTDADAAVEAGKLEIELYQLDQQVDQLFFGALLIQARLEQNSLLQEILSNNYEQIKAYVYNGLANQSDLDVVRVEQLKASQDAAGLEVTARAYCDMLSWLTGRQITDVDNLAIPSLEEFSGKPFQMGIRPEQMLLDRQQIQLDISRRQIQAGVMPQIGLFVQGGYGRPGLDMFKDSFEPFYVAGIRFNWNISNLYTYKKQNRLVDLNQDRLAIQQDVLQYNIRLEQIQYERELEKWQRLMSGDDEMIRLRTSIRKSAEAKVANGTLAVNELLREVLAEDMARRDKALHHIECVRALYQLKHSLNQ